MPRNPMETSGVLRANPQGPKASHGKARDESRGRFVQGRNGGASGDRNLVNNPALKIRPVAVTEIGGPIPAQSVAGHGEGEWRDLP